MAPCSIGVSVAIGSPFIGRVTGLSGRAIWTVSDPLAAVPGFEQASKIADNVGTAAAVPPARTRNSRRDRSLA